MKFPATALIALLFAFCSATALASALGGASIFVSPSGTDSSNCGSRVAPCRTFAGGYARAKSGDSVIASAGTYAGAGNFNLTITSGVTFSATGAGVIIDLSGSDGAPFVLIRTSASATAVIEKFSIVNFVGTVQYPADGFGPVTIYGGSSAIVRDCTFSNNSLPTGPGAAGIHLSFSYDTTVVNVDNCKFLDNASGNNNAGIITSMNAQLTVTSSVFLRNTQNAIWVYYGTVSVADSEFGFNYDGSAIFALYQSVVSVTRSTFHDNRHWAEGPNLRTEGAGGVLSVSDSDFLSASAAKNGGAIYAHSQTTVTSCLFSKNSAANGGAIYTEKPSQSEMDVRSQPPALQDLSATDAPAPSIRVVTSRFQDNVATNDGGAADLFVSGLPYSGDALNGEPLSALSATLINPTIASC